MRNQITRNKGKGSNLGANRITRNKGKGSNLGAMPENPKQKEGIESRRDGRELEIKKEGIESWLNVREPESKGRD